MQVCKQEHHEHRACHRAAKDQRLEFSPARVGVVHKRAHDGVVKRIEHAQHRQHEANLQKHRIAYGQHLGDIGQKKHAYHGIEHIPADCAEAEEILVAPRRAVFAGGHSFLFHAVLLWVE